MAGPDKPDAGKKHATHGLAEEFEDLILARESDPFRLLGPHWIERDGAKALVIRSMRPDATALTILWGPRKAEFPAARIDPAGLFEAVIPASAIGISGSEPIAPQAYRLRFRFPDGVDFETYDPYAFPPILTELRSVPLRRRHALPELRKAGRARARNRRRPRRPFRRLGAERAARQRGRRFQSLGRARAPDAQPRRDRHLGDFSARPRRRRALQIRNFLARRTTIWA